MRQECSTRSSARPTGCGSPATTTRRWKRARAARWPRNSTIAGLILRHQARAGETQPEISGHYHPRLQITVRERAIRRPCAVVSSAGRMILPAFGALTGGMNAADPAIVKALQPAAAIDAVLPSKGRLMQFPLWRQAA